MTIVRHQRMVCFDDGVDRFQMRAAGIAIEDGHVLIHRATFEKFWTFPGGRIEQGETSGETLIREMREELLVEVDVGPLSFLIESFFADIGQQFHEIGFYHAIRLPEGFSRLRGDVCHRITDGAPLEFRWVPADTDSLASWNLFPPVLRPRLGEMPVSTVHLLDRDAAR